MKDLEGTEGRMVGERSPRIHRSGIKRIGIVSLEFPPSIGGMQNYAFFLSKELVSRGYDVHLFVPRNASAIEGANLHPIMTGNTIKDLYRLRRFDMDVWHAINAGYGPLALFKRNVVVHIHGNDFLHPWVGINGRIIRRIRRPANYLLMSLGFIGATGIVANSRFTKTIFQKKFDKRMKRDAKTHVFHVGVSDEYFTDPLGKENGKDDRNTLNLVTISRLTNRRKNVDTVIEAVAELARSERRDIRYTVIGDGKDRGRLKEIVRETGMEANVHVAGFLNVEGIKEHLRKADLFVLAPKNTERDVEGFGIVYLEANACGLPVLASRNSGTEDAVEEGVSGYFVETPDKDGIKSALRKFMRGDISFDREKVIRHAENFRWSLFVDKIENILYGLR